MTIKAIENHLIFQFTESLDPKKMFREKTASGIEIVGGFHNSAASPRWGKVLITGPDVDPVLCLANCEVLIENLAWTEGVVVDKQTYWRTDDTRVMAYRYPDDKE